MALMCPSQPTDRYRLVDDTVPSSQDPNGSPFLTSENFARLPLSKPILSEQASHMLCAVTGEERRYDCSIARSKPVRAALGRDRERGQPAGGATSGSSTAYLRRPCGRLRQWRVLRLQRYL